MKTPYFPFSILKNRREFLWVSHNGEKSLCPAFVVLFIKTEDAQFRIGYTASKKIGNAVKRSLAKRRMRAVVDELVRLNPDFETTGLTMVLIARKAILNRDYAKMTSELKAVLKKDAGCLC